MVYWFLHSAERTELDANSNNPSTGYRLRGCGGFGPQLDADRSYTFQIIGEAVSVAQTPLPAAGPLFATGLGVMGWLAKRRKHTGAALAAVGECPDLGVPPEIYRILVSSWDTSSTVALWQHSKLICL